MHDRQEQSLSASDFQPMTQSSQMNPEWIVFGGTKGGVGRSILTALTALTLARRGSQVLLIDLNLGCANLHTLLGTGVPTCNLERWLIGQIDDLEPLCVPVPQIDTLQLISAASSTLHLADLPPERIYALMKSAQRFEVDYILLDLGVMMSTAHLDLLSAAHHSFCLSTPEPTSIESVYIVYKSILMRRFESHFNDRPWLKKLFMRIAQVPREDHHKTVGEVLGMIRELDLEVHQEMSALLKSLQCPLILNRALPEDEVRVVTALREICRSSLALEMQHALTLPEDDQITRLVLALKPLQLLSEESPYLKALTQWVDSTLVKTPYRPQREQALNALGHPPLLLANAQQGRDQHSHNSQLSKRLPHSEPLSSPLTLNSTLPPLTRAELVALSAQMGSEDMIHPQELTQLIKEPVIYDSSLNYSGELGEEFTTPIPPLPSETDAHNYPEFTESLLTESPPVNQDEVYQDELPALEPQPMTVALMDDPPRHEVTSLEEEVKTPEGWYHLKTSDLAPFRPSIQTSIYYQGQREVIFEESYDGVYESEWGTQIERRVERIHHESAQTLIQRGLRGWCEAHHLTPKSERDYFPLVTEPQAEYFKQ